MLKNFQSFIDYKKLIKLQSQSCSYEISRKDKNINNYMQPMQAKKQNKYKIAGKFLHLFTFVILHA